MNLRNLTEKHEMNIARYQNPEIEH